MNILHFSTYDIAAGAAKASYRLHQALRDHGHNSMLFVREKASNDEHVIEVRINVWKHRIKRLKEHVLSSQRTLQPYHIFSADAKGDIDKGDLIRYKCGEIDIICLHWISNFLVAQMIKEIYDHYQCPIVWILMDQEPVTGGCHYSFGCNGYKLKCGKCPQLGKRNSRDRSRQGWIRKHRYLGDLAITFVAPTAWTANWVKESSIFHSHNLEIIPLPIDTAIFRPVDQKIARNLLNLPQDKKIVFFGASALNDPRKGMCYLSDALEILKSMLDSRHSGLRKEDVFLSCASAQGTNMIEILPFRGKHLGYFRDDLTLALAYQAADLFICPSIEDAGPIMIPESMLCGTPVVAFNTGGACDLIETGRTGYRARYKDKMDLAEGMFSLLTTNGMPKMRIAAREVAVKAHEPAVVVEKHTELYGRLKQKVR